MQSTPKPWKQAIFAAIARLESVLRRRTAYSPTDLRGLRNFLVLQYESPLGSVVHATSFYQALKTAVPNAHVTVAASSMAASILQNNPWVDRCVATPDPSRNLMDTVRAVRGLLRSMPPGPCCIVTTVGNQRPRIALVGVLAGNALRVGHTIAPSLVDIPLTFTPERGQIAGNLDILRALGHDVAFCEPSIFIASADAAYAAEFLGATTQQTGPPRVAIVTQNSRGQRNQWPEQRFQQVCSNLSRECQATPIFVGTQADADAIEALRGTLSDQGISLAGKTTVPQLAAVLAQCDLIVSLDTGTFHVARAVGLPGVVIAPAWQSPLEWLPVGHPRYRVLRGPSISVIPPDYRMEEIEVEAVTAAAMDLLREFAPSLNDRAARLQRVLVR